MKNNKASKPIVHRLVLGEKMNPEKLLKFIDKQKVSFICSVDKDNFPNVKAMLKPRKHNGIKEFYFSTNTSSMRVKQYQENPNASIYFYHKGFIKYEKIFTAYNC